MINLNNVRVTFGKRTLFKNASFLIRPADKIGLVGPNGAGKTTVFRLITGEEHPSEGDVQVQSGIVVGYFSQSVGEMSGRTALQEVLAGAGKVYEIGKKLHELEHRMADGTLDAAGMDRYGKLQEEFLHLDGYEKETHAQTILNGLGIGPDRWEQPVETFSGGWKMRIALARILLLNPDVLLIDEPTNHLDVESIVWLEAWLKEFKGALVMTSHDREFMTRVCFRTVEVAGETITTYSGDYDFYLRERTIRREQLIASQKRQQAMLAKEEEFIARFAARASHAAQVQSRVKTIEKIERIVVPPDPKVIKFEFGTTKRSGDIVVDLQGLGKTYTLPDGRPLPVFSGATGKVIRQNKIALTGVNGAGKSTLLKIISGLIEPTEGVCNLGASVQLGYFSQYSCDVLKPDRTVFEEVQERLPMATIGFIKNLLGAFQFSGDDSDKKVSILSGGEKTRVMLAILLTQPVNFLVLDEPTNHLDIASREVLLEALQDFQGTVIIVSHDRYFLRHLVNRVFEIDHGCLRTYEGDYDYYLSKTAAQAH
ncbi:MAG TPA: ABC-F family ATP-binding cassette domain-containing protein [Candidatus Ozemobacteraceae bacterium]|nr:ABC-F family ATP-binding cassette domain-containing protein [Candidatus Ozemobacteraceae bacterium]